MRKYNIDETVAEGDPEHPEHHISLAEATNDLDDRVFELESATPGGGGEDGAAGKIVSVEAVTVPHTDPASVENLGTENEAALRFEIPQGVPGADGDDGAAGQIVSVEAVTVAHTELAGVENLGTENEAALRFYIPRGVPGEDGTGGGGGNTLVTEPNTTPPIQHEIQSDNSSSTNWLNREERYFKPWGLARKLVSWFNEYNELRLIPANDNTVALRVFVGVNQTAYDARNDGTPSFEVTDKRDGTRNTLFGIFKGGRTKMGRLESSETRTEAPTAPLINENLNYVVATTQMDHLRIWIQGVLKFWMNEWGAIRGTSPYSWGDALVRAVRENSDGITAGNAIEIVDRRTGAVATVIYGRRWTDGALVRNGVVMSDTVIIDAADTNPPANTPIGTVVYRRTT